MAKWCTQLIVVVLLSLGARDVVDSPYLEMIEEAFVSTERSVSSAICSGRFRKYAKDKGASEWSLTTDATVDCAFSGNKYFLDLRYSAHPLQISAQRIVYDEEVVASCRESKLINLTGSETEVYAPDPSRSGAVRPQLAGFPWDISRLSHVLSCVPALLANIKAERFTVDEQPNGDLLVTYPVGRGHVELICRKSDGFRVSSRRVFNGDGVIRESIQGQWRKLENVWMIESLRQELTTAETILAWEIEFTDLEANAEVTPDLFTLAAFKMPGGIRMIDRRDPYADVEDIIHFNPVADNIVDAKVGSLLEQMHPLPTQHRKPLDVTKEQLREIK